MYTKEGAFYILGVTGLGQGGEVSGRGGPGSCLLPMVSQGLPRQRGGGVAGRAGLW